MKRFAIKTIASCALLVGANLTFHAANAHVVLEYQVAPAASSYKATFKVGHGCGASPTRQVSVDIPTGMRGARPMPRPGWSVAIVREKLAAPVASHGRTVVDDVRRITWTAMTPQDALDSAHYGEFVLVAQTPAEAGPQWWPVRQVCESGRNDWVEVPGPGQKLSDLQAPAALLEVLPAGPGAGHHH